MTELRLENVSKNYGAFKVLKDINLKVESGELIVVIGPSGCGKSTLLRMIAGLETISGGQMYINEQCVNEVPPVERGVAMVFQSYALYPHMNVYKNMAFGLTLQGSHKKVIEERVNFAAQMLKLENYLERKPKELSGGQRQRVAIGRAIVRQPTMFLFDEPLSNLDAGLRIETRIEIAELHKKFDAPMIYVTHDQLEAMTLADRIVVLNGGKIEQVGKPLDLYNNPVNKFVAGFIGSQKINFLEAKVSSISEAGLTVCFEDHYETILPILADNTIQIDSPITIGIRPEHLSVATNSKGLSARVTLVEQLGDVSLIHANLNDGQTLMAKIPGQADLKEGDRVELNFHPEQVNAFGSNDQALPKVVEGLSDIIPLSSIGNNTQL